jgi:hypothetical protein
MFGFLIGTVSLLALIGVVRGGRFRRGSRRARFGHGFGPRAMFRRLFERLDTTPGQEKVIVSAMGDLRAQAKAARADLSGARNEVAEALRQESFDEVLLGGVLTRLDGSMDVMRRALLDAFGKVHGALDDRQRRVLADLVEAGPRSSFGLAHPYRL